MRAQPSVFRAGAPADLQGPSFGPLQELAGTWVGGGYNLISRPVPDPKDDQKQIFALQVNATWEYLTFDPIDAPIPDRGSVQPDITLFAMGYLQHVSDAVSKSLLHVERGMWLNVPQTTDPPQPPTVVRLATIPHGDSVLAQGSSFTVPTPQIAPVNPAPFDPKTGEPIGGGYFPPPFKPPFTVTGPLPPGFDIENPNAALTAAIEGQNITKTTVLQISTQPPAGSRLGGGILNIPFVTFNADAAALDAIFWIETVQPDGGGRPFLQLQYTQTVILNFAGISWPHVSVATLIKN